MVVAFNAGRKEGDRERLEALLESAEIIEPHWAAIYISEVGVCSSAFERDRWTTIGGHQIQRW